MSYSHELPFYARPWAEPDEGRQIEILPPEWETLLRERCAALGVDADEVIAEAKGPRTKAELEREAWWRRFHEARDYLQRRRWGRIQGRWIAAMIRSGVLAKDADGTFEILRKSA